VNRPGAAYGHGKRAPVDTDVSHAGDAQRTRDPDGRRPPCLPQEINNAFRSHARRVAEAGTTAQITTRFELPPGAPTASSRRRAGLSAPRSGLVEGVTAPTPYQLSRNRAARLARADPAGAAGHLDELRHHHRRLSEVCRAAPRREHTDEAGMRQSGASGPRAGGAWLKAHKDPWGPARAGSAGVGWPTTATGRAPGSADPSAVYTGRRNGVAAALCQAWAPGGGATARARNLGGRPRTAASAADPRVDRSISAGAPRGGLRPGTAAAAGPAASPVPRPARKAAGKVSDGAAWSAAAPSAAARGACDAEATLSGPGNRELAAAEAARHAKRAILAEVVARKLYRERDLDDLFCRLEAAATPGAARMAVLSATKELRRELDVGRSQ